MKMGQTRCGVYYPSVRGVSDFQLPGPFLAGCVPCDFSGGFQYSCDCIKHQGLVDVSVNLQSIVSVVGFRGAIVLVFVENVRNVESVLSMYIALDLPTFAS